MKKHPFYFEEVRFHRNHFCHFISASLLNGSQLLKKRICSSRSKFFPLRVDSFSKRFGRPGKRTRAQKLSSLDVGCCFFFFFFFFGGGGGVLNSPLRQYVSLYRTPGRVAQSVGHLTRKSGVLGSIPGLATYFHFSFR